MKIPGKPFDVGVPVAIPATTLVLTLDPMLTPRVIRRNSNSSRTVEIRVNKGTKVTINGVEQE